MKSIIIVDDHEMMRIGLATHIENNSDYKIIGAASSVASGFLEVEKHIPNLIIIDVDLGKESGFDLVLMLKEHFPSLKIVMYSMHDESGYILTAKKNGVNGYISKASKAEDFMECIETVMSGKDYLEERLLENQERIEDIISILTNHEIRIFREMLSGKSNDEISKTLNVTKHTVEVYATNIYEKTFCKNRTEFLKKYQKPQ